MKGETEMTMNLGRFGHHPDPAIDFCIEVEELTSIATDRAVGHHNPDDATLEPRIPMALDFAVGGDEGAVAAKTDLNRIVDSLAATR